MALKHADPGEVVDLRPLGDRFATARTSAIVRTGSFETVRLVVPAGTEVPPHKVGGEITLHCIEGHARLGLESGTVDLRAGDWVFLEGGEPHSLKGIEDTSLLLTILFDGGRNARP
jgi:quercetin dioxygenase-like cupin family protein